MEYLVADWHIESALGWLGRDLQDNRGKATIINFHDFDEHFTIGDKESFRLVLDKPEFNVIGIFFAHMHSKVGLHPFGFMCLNNKRVPLVYSGSVPASNYVMIRLNPENSNGIQGMYQFHVESDQETRVQRIGLDNASC